MIAQQVLQFAQNGCIQLCGVLLLSQAHECVLCRRRMSRGVGEAVETRQRFEQAIDDQTDQLALAEKTLGARLWIRRLPVAFEHAGQQRQGAPPALPTIAAQPRDTQVGDDSQVLALLTQVLTGRLFDVCPVD
ncbi:hypothetical protein D3C76_1169330 [compost metagenome]